MDSHWLCRHRHILSSVPGGEWMSAMPTGDCAWAKTEHKQAEEFSKEIKKTFKNWDTMCIKKIASRNSFYILGERGGAVPFPNSPLFFGFLCFCLKNLFRIHSGFLSTRTDVPEVKLFRVEVLLVFVYNWLFWHMINVPRTFFLLFLFYINWYARIPSYFQNHFPCL